MVVGRFGDGVARALPGADRVVGQPCTLGQFLTCETCQRPCGVELRTCDANHHVKILFEFVIMGNLIILTTGYEPSWMGPWIRSEIWQKAKQFQLDMAEGVGFEPTIRFPVYTLSKRAP